MAQKQLLSMQAVVPPEGTDGQTDRAGKRWQSAAAGGGAGAAAGGAARGDREAEARAAGLGAVERPDRARHQEGLRLLLRHVGVMQASCRRHGGVMEAPWSLAIHNLSQHSLLGKFLLGKD